MAGSKNNQITLNKTDMKHELTITNYKGFDLMIYENETHIYKGSEVIGCTYGDMHYDKATLRIDMNIPNLMKATTKQVEAYKRAIK